MTEKEKMLSGALYNAGDLELVWERDRAKALCEKLNVLPSGDGPARERVLSQLFGHTGGNIVVNSVFWCDYGYNIRVGDNFYVNHNCVILDCMPVTFGDNVMIGPNCGFYTASHPMDAERRRARLGVCRPHHCGQRCMVRRRSDGAAWSDHRGRGGHRRGKRGHPEHPAPCAGGRQSLPSGSAYHPGGRDDSISKGIKDLI